MNQKVSSYFRCLNLKASFPADFPHSFYDLFSTNILPNLIIPSVIEKVLSPFNYFSSFPINSIQYYLSEPSTNMRYQIYELKNIKLSLLLFKVAVVASFFGYFLHQCLHNISATSHEELLVCDKLVRLQL